MSKKPKILIIQTAFIGDVILATSLIEYIRSEFPEARIDFFLRKGNQSIIETSPHITKLYIWDKSKNKFFGLLKQIKHVRQEKYDYVLNIQRFFNSGLVTALSNAKVKIGFDKNPLSLFFTHKITHKIPHKHHEGFLHEVQRNQLLAEPIVKSFQLRSDKELRPKIHFTDEDKEKVKKIIRSERPYFVLAPSSVWYTKQWHIERWQELINQIADQGDIYLIGAPSDNDYLNPLTHLAENVFNIAGELTLRQSSLLMQGSLRTFVNDSAPLHLASSSNAKVTAIFCSTVPEFGYYPLSEDSSLVQLEPRLECMPCGLHGHKDCPKKHFKCSQDIPINRVIETIS